MTCDLLLNIVFLPFILDNCTQEFSDQPEMVSLNVKQYSGLTVEND